MTQPTRVLFLHNYPSRTQGMFMWDVFNALGKTGWLALDEKCMPLVKSLGTLRTIRSEIGAARGHYDIVHAQYGSTVGFMARFAGARQIVSFRGTDIYPHPGPLRSRLGGRLRMLMSYFAARRSDAIVVMSTAMRKRIKRWPGLRKRRIHILVDPVSPDFWPEGDHALEEAIRGTSLTVVIASRYDANPIKRLEMVAKAQQLCVAIGLSVEVKQMVALSRDAVREAIDHSDVLALASTHEGWPNIVKEALLRGKPFLSTDVSDLKQYAERFPGSAIVEADPVDFAFAFVDMLAQKVSTLGDKAAALVPFHPDVCALKHEILYRAYGTAE